MKLGNWIFGQERKQGKFITPEIYNYSPIACLEDGEPFLHFDFKQGIFMVSPGSMRLGWKEKVEFWILFKVRRCLELIFKRNYGGK